MRLVETPLGPAGVHRDGPDESPLGTLVLGHGAGGGVGSADLTAVTAAAAGAGWRVLRVAQPWQVAGRRIAPAPQHLDTAWTAVLDAVRPGLAGPLVLGGRSAGARVACRTATALGADGVLALAFPLHPPGRPERSRAAELAAAGVPLVVVQGATDAFGRPAEVGAALAGVPAASVAEVPGDHSLSRAPEAVAAAALAWLADLAAVRS
ncbi:hypothetical protein SAMN05660464_0321 [Geodermatophilus dictyosporus]|uniref:KANL3/Tex30 alpha/beta hydrolase-like domain-containing protein n=1 Tax=Geodermatophilus dictyosporus TaxID=1523247 RepID=A0A1I5UN46_9ACTN|nr:alpha/beta family hydrolase [Geodermatophilus dictyosporus]SFP96467.1 hypothetical protein SAMN05660464_0321 [Geodermatophilus dictyosporus]